jgi:hypothetical protein
MVTEAKQLFTGSAEKRGLNFHDYDTAKWKSSYKTKCYIAGGAEVVREDTSSFMNSTGSIWNILFQEIVR